MLVTMLAAKIHRATVTDANLNYAGSITIDEKLLEAAGIREFQQVEVVNINNGARFATYTMKGSDGVVCLNGAAARLAQPGDLLIIMCLSLIHIFQSFLTVFLHGLGDLKISRLIVNVHTEPPPNFICE